MQKRVMLTFSLVIKNLVEFMKPLNPIFLFSSSFFPLVIALFMLLNLGCKKSPTEPNGTATLIIEDVSCTEAWVKITSSNYQTPNTLTLFVNDKADQSITLVSNDTVLYVDSLLPNKSYTFKSQLITNNSKLITSEAQATTLDTTSHNFTWQTFTFGEHSSSVLYDVAIIDENNIWAVGEIYMNDTLGKPDPTFYNVAHWEGLKWELKKLFYKGGIWSIKTIFAFNENDIWFSGYMRYYNGQFIELPIPDILMGWTINKMWGTSSNDLYVVGNSGNIAHYDGKNWQKIESRTALQIYDIWGDYNNKTSEYEVLAIASHVAHGTERKLYQIRNGQAIDISSSPIERSLTGIWFIPNRHYYVVGSGIYEKKLLHDEKWKNNDGEFTHYYTSRVRGTEINNVFVVGALGEILHWNGISWKSLQNEGIGRYGDYSGISTKNNLVVMAGETSNQAVITICSK
jgi:hypothetical protein